MRSSSIPPQLLVGVLVALVGTACGPSEGGNNNTDQNNNTNTNQNDNTNDNTNQNNNNVIPPGCGDGVIQFGEICDCGDGTVPLPTGCPGPNSSAPDSFCRLNCQYPSCGDGIIDTDEECDGASLGGASCADIGGTGEVTCTGTCTLDRSGCSVCGNGTCEGTETVSTCPDDCGVVAVAAGGSHSCALLGEGTVRCWGDNQRGQLGDGSIASMSTAPVTVTGLTDAVGLACGTEHCCAVKADLTVWCWGYNGDGQLGIGSQINSATPAQVTGLTNVGDLTAGNRHTCAVDASGAATVKCWGANYNGQLGDGNTATFSTTPVSVLGVGGTGNLTGAFRVTAGSQHTCALVGAGAAYCWGNGGNGRLGNNSSASSPIPVSVSGAAGLSAISAGGAHTCGVLSSGVVRCWGNATDGKLGNGQATVDAWVPVDVTDITNAADVAAGTSHTCAVLTDGNARCWGGGALGQLGNGSNSSSNAPVNVSISGLGGFIDTNSNHTCVLFGATGVRCWGDGLRGQLGNGGNTASNIPVAVNSL